MKYWKDIIGLQENLKNNQTRILAISDKLEEVQRQYKELEAQANRDITQEFAYRTKLRDLNQATAELDRLLAEEKELETSLQELEGSPPSDVYLSSRDRQIIDWHFANLKFANATPLTNLSLQH